MLVRLAIKYKIIKGLLFLLLPVLFSGCAIGLALEELSILRLGLGRVGATRALTATARGVVVADEVILAERLQTVALEGRTLVARGANGVNQPFGRLASANVAEIDFYGRVTLPGKAYRIKGNGVKIRSTPSAANDYNVLYRKNTGQLVLKLDEIDGWAKVQDLGSRTIGWVSMAYLLLAAYDDGPEHEGFRFEQCGACKGQGHAMVNTSCGVCHGKGSINCGYCVGLAFKPCYQCGQTGRLTCYQCIGKGSRPCERCSATGYETDALGNKSTCTYCAGNGSLPCPDCNNVGSTKCHDCNGAGSSTCNYCQGTGKDVCYQCFQAGTVRLNELCAVCLGTGWRKIYH